MRHVIYRVAPSNILSVEAYSAEICKSGLYVQETAHSASANFALEAIRMSTLIPALRLVARLGNELSKETSMRNAVAAILLGAVFKNSDRSIRPVRMGS